MEHMTEGGREIEFGGEFGTPIWFPVSAKLFARYKRIEETRVGEYIDAIADAANVSSARIIEMAEDIDPLADALRIGASRAANVPAGDYRDVLARTAAAAFADTTRIDEVAAYIDCLVELTPVQLRLLVRTMQCQVEIYAPNIAFAEEWLAHPDIQARLPRLGRPSSLIMGRLELGHAFVLGQAIALQSKGLLTDTEPEPDASGFPPPHSVSLAPYWAVTESAARMLALGYKHDVTPVFAGRIANWKRCPSCEELLHVRGLGAVRKPQRGAWTRCCNTWYDETSLSEMGIELSK